MADRLFHSHFTPGLVPLPSQIAAPLLHSQSEPWTFWWDGAWQSRCSQEGNSHFFLVEKWCIEKWQFNLASQADLNHFTAEEQRGEYDLKASVATCSPWPAAERHSACDRYCTPSCHIFKQSLFLFQECFHIMLRGGIKLWTGFRIRSLIILSNFPGGSQSRNRVLSQLLKMTMRVKCCWCKMKTTNSLTSV